MIRKILLGIWLALSYAFSSPILAQGSTERLNVTTPGSLRDLVNELPSSRIRHLSISGLLNGADIAYLVGGAGRMTKVDSLDISEITLVQSPEPYKTLLVNVSDVGFGTTTEIYYISDTYEVISESESTGLGGSIVTRHVFCNDLSGAFAESAAFKYVVMPKSLSRVGNYLCFKNSTIEEIILPDKVTELGYKALYGSGVKNVSIPKGVKTIPNDFAATSAIEKLYLPISVDSIKDNAFGGCPISEVNLEKVCFVGRGAFQGNHLTGTLNLSSISLIEPYSFSSSSSQSLDTIIFPSSLKVIPEYAFQGLGMSSISLPSNLTTIGAGAFSNCKNLSSVSLPSSLSNLASTAFSSTPWEYALKGDNGVVYAGNIALRYDEATAPKDKNFSFRDGTVAIADFDDLYVYHGFFPYNIEELIQSINFPESLEKIGSLAFYNCKNLEKVILPEGLKTLGAKAFSGCESLKAIKLPENLTALPSEVFSGCKKIEQIEFPKALKRIESAAFSGCEALFFDSIPESVCFIGEKAFADCKAIPQITLHEGLDSIGTGAFKGCNGIEQVKMNARDVKTDGSLFGDYRNKNTNIYRVIIGKNVRSLPDYIFAWCAGLTKLDFENIESSSLKIIGNNVFRASNSLGAQSSLNITSLPSSIEYIGSSAFCQCQFNGIFNLKNIKYIGAGAFEECRGMTELIIPEGTIYIGGEAFSGCPDLKTVRLFADSIRLEEGSYSHPFNGNGTRTNVETVEIGPNVGIIPSSLFSYMSSLKNLVFYDRGNLRATKPLVIGNYAFDRCGLQNELNLPYGTVSIGESAFADNHQLVSVNIPGTCRSIGSTAFANCDAVHSFNITEGLDSIGESAFSGCLSIQSMTLPSTCIEIGNEAFRRCDLLNDLTLLSDMPPNFGIGLGYGFHATIFVPEKSLELYKKIPTLSGYKVEPIHDSGIDDIDADTTLRTIEGIYTIEGHYIGSSINAITLSGLYIVRYNDGTVKKIYFPSKFI